MCKSLNLEIYCNNKKQELIFFFFFLQNIRRKGEIQQYLLGEMLVF